MKMQPVSDGLEVTFTLFLDTPREIVWKAWTDSNYLAVWWGPYCFTNPVCEVDLRQEGILKIDMQAPDGTVYPMVGVFKEIIEPKKLSFSSVPLDEENEPLFEVLTTVNLSEHENKTKLVLNAKVLKTTDKAYLYLMGMEEGWIQSLERLAALVSKKETAKLFLKLVSLGFVREAYNQYVDKDFFHHNAFFAGDRESLLIAMEESAVKNSEKNLEIKQAIEEGDRVVIYSHLKFKPGDLGMALVHIFRFQNKRIAELWDLGQSILENSPNKNGMF